MEIRNGSLQHPCEFAPIGPTITGPERGEPAIDSRDSARTNRLPVVRPLRVDDALARYKSLLAGTTVDPCENVTGEPSLTRPWTEAERAPIAVVTARRVRRSFDGGQFTVDVKSDVLQRHIIRGGYTLDRVVARIDSGEIPTSCDVRLFRSCAAWNERRHTIPFAIGEFVVTLRICGHCISTFHDKYAIGESRTIETYDVCRV